MNRFTHGFVALIAAVCFLMGCADGPQDDPAVPDNPPAGEDATTISVELFPDEDRIEIPAVVTPGTVRFEITNFGSETVVFAVRGDQVDEQSMGIEPNETIDFLVDLMPGLTYELVVLDAGGAQTLMSKTVTAGTDQ